MPKNENEVYLNQHLSEIRKLLLSMKISVFDNIIEDMLKAIQINMPYVFHDVLLLKL